MRIYTRMGDERQTAVIGGRMDKDDVRVESYGTVDELNSFVGMAIGLLNVEREPICWETCLKFSMSFSIAGPIWLCSSGSCVFIKLPLKWWTSLKSGSINMTRKHRRFVALFCLEEPLLHQRFMFAARLPPC